MFAKDLIERGVRYGDVLSTKNGSPAIVKVCQHVKRRHVLVVFDVDRFVIVDYPDHKGSALKMYLKNQKWSGDILRMTVTHTHRSSVVGKVDQ